MKRGRLAIRFESVGERVGVHPFGQKSPHHPFGLVSRLGSIRPGPAVAEPELLTRGREVTAPVAASVVGENPLDRDPVAGIEAPGAAEEVGRRHWALVGQLLGIGEPAVVVDRDWTRFQPIPRCLSLASTPWIR
jgi:hypothetical protein